jgi:hypothetical protein
VDWGIFGFCAAGDNGKSQAKGVEFRIRTFSTESEIENQAYRILRGASCLLEENIKLKVIVVRDKVE